VVQFETAVPWIVLRTLHKTKRMRLQLGLPSLTPHDSRRGQVHFLFSRGFGPARLRHFFLDAGERRFAGFFF